MLITRLCFLSLIASAGHAATLQVILTSSGPYVAPANQNQIGQAPFELSNSASGSGIGYNGFGNSTHQRSLYGRAGYGSLGASVSASTSGSYFASATSGTIRGYSNSSFSELLNYSILSGTVAYLALDWILDGSGTAIPPVFSSWNVQASVSANGTPISSSAYGCYGGQPQGGVGPTCSASGSSPAIGGNLNTTILFATNRIPSFSSYLILAGSLEVSYTLNENFSGTPGASIAADYSNTSRIGGLRFLDENFNPLAVNFTSESGHDYTQPLSNGAVPEPSTSLMLFTCGAMGILRQHFRSRKSS